MLIRTRIFLICVFSVFGLMGWSQLAKPTNAKPTNAQPAIAKSALENGKNVYLLHCLACHQTDGGGVPGLNPPVDGSSAVKGNDKAKLIRIVLKGAAGSAEIDGEHYSNIMAPHADLTDQQIADVLTYIRNNWSNKATAVNAAEVKALRAKLK
jgi:mono/diheme cytochrome c family protein